MTCAFVLVRLRAWQALLLGVLRIWSDIDHLRPFLDRGGLGVVWVVSRGAGGARGATVLCGARGPRAGSPWMPRAPRTTICRIGEGPLTGLCPEAAPQCARWPDSGPF